MSAPRVVSLIASATEIVCALGFEDFLVGRSHECDYPPSVRRLPVCSEPRIDVEGTSRQIDERVKATVQAALSVYRVHADVLQALRPEIIITQTQCEVCAVTPRDVEEALCRTLDFRPQLLALEPNRLEDVWENIRSVAAALDAPGRGETLVARLQARLAAIAAAASALRQHPTVACIEWIDPLMAAGNWMPTLVEAAGGVNLFGEAGEHSPWMTWEQLLAADPEAIAVLPCGWDIAKARTEMASLTCRPEWPRLRAVRTGRVFLCDGNQYFNRPGPRLVESAEILAEVLHPQAFRFGHEGTGWAPV